jgi:hypothetical protein
MALFDRPVVAVAHPVDETSIQRKEPNPSAWQTTAWSLWRQLGELHYPTTQVARLVSRVEWVTKPQANIDELFPGLGAAEAGRLIALNLQVAGECWPIYTDRDRDGHLLPEKRWEILSVVAPKLRSRIDQAESHLRVYNPDPTDFDKADSAVRGAIGPATELLTLESLSRAQSRSRISQAGILLRPSTPKKMVDHEGNKVDFNEMLTKAMTAPIIDETSSAALVPIDLEFDPELIEKWRHLTLDRPYDERLSEKMERSIRRIALALDIWPELLLGMADVNHWGSWFLAEDTWTGHVAPLAEQVAEAFVVASAEVANTELEITPNPAALLARRSTVADALDSAKIGAVGLAWVREAVGAEDGDKPTDEDLEILAALLGKTVPGEEEEPVEEGPPATEEEATRGVGGEPAAPIAAAVETTGDPVADLGVGLARIDDQLRGWLQGAAEAVVPMARSRVGHVLRTRLKGGPELVTIDAVDNEDVVSRLGLARALELAEPDALVRAIVEPVGARWLARLEAATSQIERLAHVDLSGVAEQEHREASVQLLVDELTGWIVETLAQPTSQLGAGPDLWRVLAVAGGSVV